MEIAQPDLQDFKDWVYSTEAQVLHKPGWSVGKVPVEEEVDLSTNVRRGILDPRAAHMFELYARLGPGFTWENRDPNIVTKYNVATPTLGLGGPIIRDKLWWYASANLPGSKTTGRIWACTTSRPHVPSRSAARQA